MTVARPADGVRWQQWLHRLPSELPVAAPGDGGRRGAGGRRAAALAAGLAAPYPARQSVWPDRDDGNGADRRSRAADAGRGDRSRLAQTLCRRGLAYVVDADGNEAPGRRARRTGHRWETLARGYPRSSRPARRSGSCRTAGARRAGERCIAPAICAVAAPTGRSSSWAGWTSR